MLECSRSQEQRALYGVRVTVLEYVGERTTRSLVCLSDPINRSNFDRGAGAADHHRVLYLEIQSSVDRIFEAVERPTLAHQLCESVKSTAVVERCARHLVLSLSFLRLLLRAATTAAVSERVNARARSSGCAWRTTPAFRLPPPDRSLASLHCLGVKQSAVDAGRSCSHAPRAQTLLLLLLFRQRVCMKRLCLLVLLGLVDQLID